MAEMSTSTAALAGRGPKTQALFDDHLQLVLRRTDRMFAGLLVCEWLFGIGLALWVSPRAWQGTVSQVHVHVWAAVLLGGAIISWPIGLALTRPGNTATRHVIAVAQMLLSSLLIHLTGGRIETHFHVFGSLAFLAFYRDWRVLITASAVVALDHFLRGLYWPQSVYGVLTRGGWRWLEHAGWVLFEDVFLIASCRQGIAEMWQIAERQAQSLATTALVEAAVIDRTRELQNSQERFRSLSASSPVGILQTDPEGTCLYANERWQAISGLTPEESFGLGWLAAVAAEDRDRVAAALRPERQSSAAEFQVRGQDGTSRWARLQAATTCSATGEVIGCVATVEDITEHRQAEEQVRASEELFKAFMDNSPAIAFMKDEAGRHLYVNRTFERAFDRTFADVANQTDEDLWPPDVARALRENDRAVLAGGKPVELTEEVPAPDGTIHSWTVYKFPITDARGRTLLAGMAVDITERKQLEEQLRQSQKMEAIGQLAGGVAHDFNNLLTAITGYAQLLLRRLPPESPLQREVYEIHKAGLRAAALTRQLLAFSRRQVLKPTVLDLNATVIEMDSMLRRLIGEHIEFTTLLAADLGRVKADPSQLEQVLVNLVVNARDAMPQGGRLTIETGGVRLGLNSLGHRGRTRSGTFVRLAVSDTGCGMDAETRARIFEPFFTTKPVGKGTGLGLSTVYGIIEQSGGTIDVYSEPGQGTTFKIYLPEVEPAQAPGSPAASSRVDTPGGSEVILLAEDEDGVRQLVAEVLREFGYQVLVARDGEGALACLAHHEGPIDALVTDVVMPGMSGRELAGRVCQARPGTRVLYMSGYTDEAIVQHGVLDPGTHFLEKPFTPEALALKLREVLALPRAA